MNSTDKLTGLILLVILALVMWVIIATAGPPQEAYHWTRDDGATCVQFKGTNAVTCYR